MIPEVLQSGKEYDFAAVVVNESDQPARLVGARDSCTQSGCFSGRKVPTIIPAWGRSRVIVHIEAGVPGDLSEELTFYTDRPSQPTVVVKLAGTIREAPPLDSTTYSANP